MAGFRFYRSRVFPRAVLLAVLLAGGFALAEGLGLTPAVFAWVEGKYGSDARKRLESLQNLVVKHRKSSINTKLKKTNDFFNDIPYRLDQSQWKERDYWATPIELLGTKGGDCEDYAIGKYFTLREMGVPAKKLRITYVKAIKLREAHMVLAYYPTEEAEPLILDNINKSIKPASKRKDLVPVYSFNGDGLWLAVNRSKGKKVGSSGKIKLWSKLQDKMAAELKR